MQKEPRHRLSFVCKIFLKNYTYSSEEQSYTADVCYIFVDTNTKSCTVLDTEDFDGDKQPSLHLTLTQEW